MTFLTDSLWVDVLIGVLTLLVVAYFYFSHKNNYWKNLGVPFIKPVLGFGNSKEVVFGKKGLFELYADVYKQLEGEKFGGFYELLKPNLMFRDPELIERVLVKDFSHFVDRAVFVTNPEKQPLSAGLSLLMGNQWRFMRHKMTPTFTTGKLKGMFDQIHNCGEVLVEELKKLSDGGEAVDAKIVTQLFTSDVIASCAFGVQYKHDSKEFQAFRDMSIKAFYQSRLQMVRFLLILVFPKFVKWFNWSFFPMDVSDFFLNMTKANVEYREKNNIKRNDFLQLLLNLRDQEKSGKVIEPNEELKDEDEYLRQDDYKPALESNNNLELTVEVIAAQAFLFLTAGSEGVSNAIGNALYSLADNIEVQRKAQEEVDLVLTKHGQWSYQAVKEMTYLDQIIQESLRIHPFSVVIQRVCTSPYKIPGTDIVLRKGQNVTIPVYPIHVDPRYYPEPDTFDPERFKDNNHRPSALYLPFGDGPRMCIAMRFAILEIKVCLARVLSEFSLSVNEKTSRPLKFDLSTFVPRPVGGMWLDFHSRQKNK